MTRCVYHVTVRVKAPGGLAWEWVPLSRLAWLTTPRRYKLAGKAVAYYALWRALRPRRRSSHPPLSINAARRAMSLGRV